MNCFASPTQTTNKHVCILVEQNKTTKNNEKRKRNEKEIKMGESKDERAWLGQN